MSTNGHEAASFPARTPSGAASANVQTHQAAARTCVRCLEPYVPCIRGEAPAEGRLRLGLDEITVGCGRAIAEQRKER